MCLIVDDREEPLLVRLLSSQSVPVECARLESGDICFEGIGPGNHPALIGFERKHLADVVNSFLNRRLSGHQIRTMLNTYSYCYLIVEDVWRPDENGGICILSGKSWMPFTSFGAGITYRQLDGFLSSLELLANVIVLRTTSIRETANLLISRYQWWQKPWTDHHSHDEIYAPGPEIAPTRGRARFYTRPPNLVEKIAAQLPGIDRKAWDVGKRFSTVDQMINASEKDWMEIPGIGKGIAGQVWNELHNRSNGK